MAPAQAHLFLVEALRPPGDTKIVYLGNSQDTTMQTSLQLGGRALCLWQVPARL